jgi:hypothetical protein
MDYSLPHVDQIKGIKSKNFIIFNKRTYNVTLLTLPTNAMLKTFFYVFFFSSI